MNHIALRALCRATMALAEETSNTIAVSAIADAEAAIRREGGVVLALAKLKDAAEPFHRLDLDIDDEWAKVCEPLRHALVEAGEVLRIELRDDSR